LVTLEYGARGFIRDACALLAQGADVEVGFAGIRARLLRLALPVARFLTDRSHDPGMGDEPSTLAFLRGFAVLATALVPFTRTLMVAMTQKRQVQVSFVATQRGYDVRIRRRA
jgi:hypothetical protein